MDQRDTQTALEDLALVIRELKKQVETLWLAVDDLREEVVTEFRHLRGEPLDQVDARESPPFHLTSLPLNACDPDFHKKVNNADANEAPLPEMVATTLDQFLARLMAKPPTKSVSSDCWNEDQPYIPGEVLEIDAEIVDWFAERLVLVLQRGDCFVLADGDDCHYALWNCDTRCFVQRFAAHEESLFSELMGAEQPFLAGRQSLGSGRHPNAMSQSAESQGTLW